MPSNAASPIGPADRIPRSAAGPTVPSRRAVVHAAAWAAPAVAVAATAPAAAASVPPTPLRTIDYVNYAAANFANYQISVYRPLVIQVVGSIAAGERIYLSAAATMRNSGSAALNQPTPLRIFATDGTRFSVAYDGLDTVLTARAALPEGIHNKTISWVPLDGRTTAQTEATILGWGLGSYEADIFATIGAASSPPRTYALTRTLPGDGDDD